MSFFKKIYDRGEEQVNKLKQKITNPVDEFKNELNKLKNEHSLIDKYLAQLIAARIRAEKDIQNHILKIENYTQKVKDALNLSEKGEMTKAAAEKIALHTLSLKKAYEERIDDLKIKIPQFDEEIENLKDKVSEIKDKIKHYQVEYEFLKSKTEIKTNANKLKDKVFFDYSQIIDKLEGLKKKIETREYKEDYYSKYSQDFEVEDDVNTDSLEAELQEIKDNLKKK